MDPLKIETETAAASSPLRIDTSTPPHSLPLLWLLFFRSELRRTVMKPRLARSAGFPVVVTSYEVSYEL